MKRTNRKLRGKAVVVALAVLGLVTSVAGSAWAGKPGESPTGGDSAPRVENIVSPQFGLGDQEVQAIAFEEPLNTSLVTVANRGGTGHRSFYVALNVSGGGTIQFQVKEDRDDVMLPLAQPIPVTGVWIRCDSYSGATCQYTVSLAGN